MNGTILKLSTFVMPAFAQANGFDDGAACPGCGGHGFMTMGVGTGGYWFWVVIMLIFWILVITGIVYLVKYLVAAGTSTHKDYSKEEKSMKSTKKEESPMDTLKKRYAKGEITKDQFDQMKKDLE